MLQAGLALQQRTSLAADEVRGFVCAAVKERKRAGDNEAPNGCLRVLPAWA